MTETQLAAFFRDADVAAEVKAALERFPRLEAEARVAPVSRAWLEVRVSLRVAAADRAFFLWVFVLDVNGENLLHWQPMELAAGTRRVQLRLRVPVTDPPQSYYFLRLAHDRLFGVELQLPLPLHGLVLPPAFPLCRGLEEPAAPVRLPRPAAALFQALGFASPTPVQAHALAAATEAGGAFLLAAEGNSGKFCVALARCAVALGREPDKKVLILFADAEQLARKGGLVAGLGVEVRGFSGDPQRDAAEFGAARVVVATARDFDRALRSTRLRAALGQLSTIVCTGLEQISAQPEMEACLCRILADGLGAALFLVSRPLANFDAVCEWLGVGPAQCFCFAHTALNRAVDVRVHAFSAPAAFRHGQHLRAALPTALAALAAGAKVAVVLETVDEARSLLAELLQRCAQESVAVAGPGFAEVLAQTRDSLEDFFLATLVELGAGYAHAAQPPLERQALLELFGLGALRVLCLPSQLVSALHAAAVDAVVLPLPAGTPLGAGRQALAALNHPAGAAAPVLHVLVEEWRRDGLEAELFAAAPAESGLLARLAEALCAEVAGGAVESRQDCLDWLTWTFLYRRAGANPGFYGAQGSVAAFLSAAVDAALEELSAAECVVEEAGRLVALPRGLICSFYAVGCATLKDFAAAARTLRLAEQLTAAICVAEEFVVGALPPRMADAVQRCFSALGPRPEASDFGAAETLLRVFFAAYQQRRDTGELGLPEERVVRRALHLLQVWVDGCAAEGLLFPALLAMRLAQALVQRMRVEDSSLLQLPFFGPQRLEACRAHGLLHIADFLSADEVAREAVLAGLTPAEIGKVASAANRYPAAELTAAVVSDAGAAEVVVECTLSREGDAEDIFAAVMGQGACEGLVEQWWLLAAVKEDNRLLAVKKIAVREAEITRQLRFERQGLPARLTVYAVCEAYVGCDIERQISRP